MATESDVDNWQLGRDNNTTHDKNQTVFVKGSRVVKNETLFMLSNNRADESIIVRLTVEELDALIVLLRYRRSLIDDIPDPKEAT